MSLINLTHLIFYYYDGYILIHHNKSLVKKKIKFILNFILVLIFLYFFYLFFLLFYCKP